MSALVKVNFRVQGSIGLKARRLGGWKAGKLEALKLSGFIA